MSTALRLLTLALLACLGCSAPERANRSARCEVDSDCSQGRVCYRGFCVNGSDPADPPVDTDTDTDGDPSTALDASQPRPSEPAPDASSPTRPTEDASAPRDASTAQPSNDATAPPQPRDAEVQPPVDAAPMGPPDPPVDSGTGPRDEDATVTPPPPPDASAPNNNDDLQRDLGVCLVRCRNNEAICYNCFRRIVQDHPEVCTESNPMGVDAFVRNLCGILCPTPAACAPRGGQ